MPAARNTSVKRPRSSPCTSGRRISTPSIGIQALRGGDERLPPLLVVAVPGDRLGDRRLEVARRRPAERGDRTGRNGIAAVVLGAVVVRQVDGVAVAPGGPR